MGFDGKRGKVLLFGGFDVASGGSLSDLWELDPTTFAWSQHLTGAEGGVPSPRMYASLVSDDVSGLLELVAGLAAIGGGPYPVGGTSGTAGTYDTGGTSGSAGTYNSVGIDGSGGTTAVPVPIGPGYGGIASPDVWELDPTKPAFVDRSIPSDVPSPRNSQALAYFPDTGRTYLFGGYDALLGQTLDDLWEWDGKVWAKVAVDSRPPARGEAALAYDPVRKSLILFGGVDYAIGLPCNDTWELGNNKKWTKLAPLRSPDALFAHGMVTDTTRKKILLYGGMGINYWSDTGFYKDPVNNNVWEWDGATTTWTNRTPPNAPLVPPSLVAAMQAPAKVARRATRRDRMALPAPCRTLGPRAAQATPGRATPTTPTCTGPAAVVKSAQPAFLDRGWPRRSSWSGLRPWSCAGEGASSQPVTGRRSGFPARCELGGQRHRSPCSA